MGMFSWKCKGCKEEIISGERARFDGCKGEYGGYGDCGNFHYSSGEPVAWHEFCYQKATPEQKLDETPSPSAPHQGFGYYHLEFLAEYKKESETKFSVIISVRDGPGVVKDDATDRYHFPLYYVTADGLKDQALWDDRERKALDSAKPGEWDKIHTDFDERKAPRSLAKHFATLKEAKETAEKIVADGFVSYSIHILGAQQIKVEKAFGEEAHKKTLEGEVYRFDRHEKIDYKWSEGKSGKATITKTGVFKESSYLWSRCV